MNVRIIHAISIKNAQMKSEVFDVIVNLDFNLIHLVQMDVLVCIFFFLSHVNFFFCATFSLSFSFSVDLNECQINSHECLESQRCDNTIGSYTCIRLQSCGTGYTLNAETGECDDDDECALGRHNCRPPYECLNTKGSFRCTRVVRTTTTTTTTSTTTTRRPTSMSSAYSRLTVGGDGGGSDNGPRTYWINPTTPRITYPPCDIGFERSALGACVGKLLTILLGIIFSKLINQQIFHFIQIVIKGEKSDLFRLNNSLKSL